MQESILPPRQFHRKRERVAMQEIKIKKELRKKLTTIKKDVSYKIQRRAERRIKQFIQNQNFK